MLTGADPPTAIVCGNDVIALGALSAARELRISIPEKLTVIGFDDIPMAAWPLISLTTIHCDLEALAECAVDLLLAQFEEPVQTPVLRRVPVSLVLRATHGPPG